MLSISGAVQKKSSAQVVHGVWQASGAVSRTNDPLWKEEVG